MQLQIEIADTFFARFRGLMLRKKLPAGHGLLIAPCNSIHMCFMRFAIDAIFIDKDYHVLKISRNVKPWTGIAWCWNAWGVIEVTAGNTANLQTGETLLINTVLKP
ncbi:MAG: DUF192 domain-containing protein [Selenomonas sp.]|uniref:DUF192 domain-containing protein n=1 Tax=Selenomonas sp. TaxID=2053611 RepID=UPI0025FEFC78|nr:DUF192 domain-containing protein [Selenomonas sp.]MCR5758505.1 DUF192 domain-containing protein [Selenomonas sp.]